MMHVIKHRSMNMENVERWAWPAVIAVWGILIGALALNDSTWAARPALTIAFLVLCPGMAFVRLLRTNNRFTEFTLAIALSLGLDAVIAIVLLYTHIWSPLWGLIVLIGVALVGVLLQCVFRRPVSSEREVR